MEARKRTGVSVVPVIQEVFSTMNYSEQSEKCEKANRWFESRNRTLRTSSNLDCEVIAIDSKNNSEIGKDLHVQDNINDNIKKMEKTCRTSNKWPSFCGLDRMKVIDKLAKEIQKNSQLIAEIEFCARGLRIAETTHKALPLLIETLQYYSCIAASDSTENIGTAVIFISDESCLSTFGYALGPALAAGKNVSLLTAPVISAVATLLVELAHGVGIPNEALCFLPGNVNILAIRCNYTTITIFDNLNKEKYNVVNYGLNNVLLSDNSSKIPLLIFDSADIDSACQSVIDAVWNYKGMLPWSAREVIVQENIYEKVVKKLKQKLVSLELPHWCKGRTNQVLAKKMATLLLDAQKMGVEVFQPEVNSLQHLRPTLLIGGKVTKQNIVGWNDDSDIPVATILAFRNINEAVALANNNKQGLAASVWTENLSIANEVVRKLEVANIWINCHGLFAPDKTFSPMKGGANTSYFGGIQGYREYLASDWIGNPDVKRTGNKETLVNAITAAKKGHQSWSRLSQIERKTKLINVAEYISKNKQQLSSKLSTEGWLDNWVRFTFEYIMECRSGDVNSTYNGYAVQTYRTSRGVLCVDVGTRDENQKLIITALAEGNSVLLVDIDGYTNCSFFQKISQLLPIGCLNIVPFFDDIYDVIDLDDNVNTYFVGYIYKIMSIQRSIKYARIKDTWNWNEIYNKVTYVKNVWSTSSQSFI